MSDETLAATPGIQESAESTYPNGWRGVIAGLDIPTGDGRYLATPPGGVRTRQYPLSLTLDHVGDGPAPVIGSVDRVWTQDGMLMGEGQIDLGGAAGADFARQLQGGFINTVSIHPDQLQAYMGYMNPDGSVVNYDTLSGPDQIPADAVEVVVFADWRLAGLAVVPIPAYTEARIEGVYGYSSANPSAIDAIISAATGSTSLPVADSGHAWDGGAAGGRVLDAATTDGKINVGQASRGFLWRDGDGSKRGDYKFPFADIVGGTLTIIPRGVSAAAGRLNQAKGVDRAAVSSKICALYAKIQKSDANWPDCPMSLIASVGGQVFNVNYFSDPKLSEPTPLTIDADGRVYGHIALWDSCYQYADGANAFSQCTKPPHSATGYSRFHTHRANVGGGEFLSVGVLTYGSGHVAKGGLRASQENYANVATQAAKVVAGEDKFGVWVSGEVLDAARDSAHDILDSPLSGHWEPDADAVGNLELIAAHIVNVPGFAVRPIIASFGDGATLDGLTLTSKIKRAVAEKTDDLADLAGIIADAVIVKMELRETSARIEAANAMKQVHKASVIARIQKDERNQRAAALQARLGF